MRSYHHTGLDRHQVFQCQKQLQLGALKKAQKLPLRNLETRIFSPCSPLFENGPS